MMSLFQDELDVTVLDYNHHLKNDVRAFVEATKSTVVMLDMYACGSLSYFCSKFIGEKYHRGSLTCETADSFIHLLGASSSMYSPIPNNEFAMSSAGFLAKRFKSNVGLSISGIRSFPDRDDNITGKVFLGYSFYGKESVKQLECSGTEAVCVKQLVNGVFGYLKLMFENFISEKKGD